MINQHIKPMQVLKYMALPGIIPRLKELGASGFRWLAYLMAYLYASVRLLPADHPYLVHANIGRYGVRHVIAEAANRLVFRKENIDQIVMFFLLLTGFVLLVLQFVVLIGGFILNPAFAGDAADYQGFFATVKPENDIALMLLDKIFAIPDLFGSKYAPAGPDAIPAFNAALHKLLEYYSMMILIVAVLIFLYYVLVVVAETAMTGTPFGRRFSHIYAPIRLVIAVGLLVPVNYGLNSAQYITLFAAKYGSGLATNGWILFNKGIANAAAKTAAEGGNQHELIARPNVPDVSSLAAFMSIVHTCVEAYKIIHDELHYNSTAHSLDPADIKAYHVKNGKPTMDAAVGSYRDALTFFDNQDVIITFGWKDEEIFRTEKGFVFPICGEVRVQTNDVTMIGAMQVQEHYYDLMIKLFNNEDDVGKPLAEMADRAVQIFMALPEDKKVDPESITVTYDNNPNEHLPSEQFAQRLAMDVIEQTKNAIFKARDDMLASPNEYQLEQELIDRGWGGAAIWYNRIAMWNGAFLAAAINYPTPSRMPYVMETVQKERLAHNQNVDTANRYAPLNEGEHETTLQDKEKDIAKTLNQVYGYWIKAPINPIEGQVSGNGLTDVLNMLFGLGGLMEMRSNADIHPLAQLTALGKGIVESAIRNLMIGLAFSFGGGFATILEQHIGPGLTAISGMAMTLTSVGLTVGFVLFYVMPFLPFIYFFFAVSAWVKSIFEAMVGVPLWALAHLKIDGHGLPGDQAMNGYFLIFEIFIRPILTLFGLLASIVIFSALAKTLNEIFPLVIGNLTGFAADNRPSGAGGTAGTGSVTGPGDGEVDSNPIGKFKRGVVDEFFFTVIYTIFIYLTGTSSFKLIDMIPGNILRWMGAGVQTFADSRDDPTSGLVQYAAIGGSTMTGQITGAMSEGAKLGGQVAGAGPAVLRDILTRDTPNVTGRTGNTT